METSHRSKNYYKKQPTYGHRGQIKLHNKRLKKHNATEPVRSYIIDYSHQHKMYDMLDGY